MLLVLAQRPSPPAAPSLSLLSSYPQRAPEKGPPTVAVTARPSPQYAPESAPESGTLREAAYPLEGKESASSEEEGGKGG